jgi:hypothetical protein
MWPFGLHVAGPKASAGFTAFAGTLSCQLRHFICLPLITLFTREPLMMMLVLIADRSGRPLIDALTAGMYALDGLIM